MQFEPVWTKSECESQLNVRVTGHISAENFVGSCSKCSSVSVSVNSHFWSPSPPLCPCLLSQQRRSNRSWAALGRQVLTEIPHEMKVCLGLKMSSTTERKTESRRTLPFINPIASGKKLNTPRSDTLKALSAGSEAHAFHEATDAICWDCDTFKRWQPCDKHVTCVTCVTCMPCIFNLLSYYHISQHTTCISHHVNRCSHCQRSWWQRIFTTAPRGAGVFRSWGFSVDFTRQSPWPPWSHLVSKFYELSFFLQCFTVLHVVISVIALAPQPCRSCVCSSWLKPVQPIQPKE